MSSHHRALADHGADQDARTLTIGEHSRGISRYDAVTLSHHTPQERSSIPRPGLHGGDGPLIARALGLDPASILDLSQSMNPFAPSVSSMVAEHLATLGTYPHPEEATHALAAVLEVGPEQILITNGASEAISLVTREIGGQVSSEPEFSLHPRGSSGPVWRSDPHNPSGVIAAEGDIADVWDEAFYPLATGRWSATRPGVTIGSLTKVFTCPGLRLGYILSDDIDRFARHQPAWSVNSLAAAVLPDLLDAADLPAWARVIATARGALATMLRDRGFDVRSGEAPWVVAYAPGLRERLAPLGVIVRDCASFGLSGYVRIAVPDEDGLSRLTAALDETALDGEPS